MRALLLSVLVSGCGWESSPARRATEPVEVHRAAGYSINTVAGSRVELRDDVLAVDSEDGYRWMEARWLTGAVAPQLTAWSVSECQGLIWERVASPIAGTLTQLGLCTRSGQEYWTFIVLETRAERTLMISWLAHRERVAYEDAWVEFSQTALTLSGADTPVETMDAHELRLLVRQTAHTSTGLSPVPGGGVLGAAISERLTELWTRRLAAADPSW